MSEADQEKLRSFILEITEHVEALEDIYGLPRADVVVEETLPPRDDT